MLCRKSKLEFAVRHYKNKELWASHIRFQNDKEEEAIYSLDILKEVLDSKKDGFIKHGLNIDKFLRLFLYSQQS